MIQITLEGARQNDGTEPSKEVSVPVLPQIGSVVAYDPIEGLSGTVRNVYFWWDEKGKLTITVQIR